MDDQSRDQLRFDRKIFSKKSLQKHLDPGADFVLVNCAFFGSGWWPGPSLQYTSFHVCRISCWLPGPTFSSVFFSTTRDFCAGLLSFFKPKLCDFWCSFCACLLCFFERNLAISGARFALVSCAFLNETWRFLVLVLCWSLVLF